MSKALEFCEDCGGHCFSTLCRACHQIRLANANRDLRADVARLTRELEEAREVLRSVDTQTYSLGIRCASCGKHLCYHGHAPGCRLVAVLGDF